MYSKQQNPFRFTGVKKYTLLTKDIETIFQSIERGDVSALEPYTMHLISSANTASIKDPKYKLTMVQYAAMVGRLNILQWFFKQGIATESSFTENAFDINGLKDLNSILIAAIHGHKNILIWLQSCLGSKVLAAQRTTVEQLDIVLFAAIYGHLELFKWLVAQDYDVNVSDCWGNPPLLCAARNGHVVLVKWMVEFLKVPLDVKNMHGDGTINLAVANGQLELLNYVYEKKPTFLNERSATGITPAMCAARYNTLNVLQWLCEKQGLLPIANQRAKDGTTVFSAALSYGSLDVFQWLVTQVYGNGESPDLYGFLHFAARRGQLEIVEWLITVKNLVLDEKTVMNAHKSMNGALLMWLGQYQQSKLSHSNSLPSAAKIVSAIDLGDLEALKTMHLQYPLNMLAEQYHLKLVPYVATKGQLEILQWLINDNIFSEFSLTEGENAILLAISGGHVNIVEWVHQQLGRQVITAQYAKDYDGVLLAAYYGHLLLLKWFFEHNYFFGVHAKSGFSPLSAAIKGNHYKVVEWLLNEGPNVYELAGEIGDVRNPVWLATSLGHLDILQLLDRKGYSLNCVNADGDTVVHLAAMNGFSPVVLWLVNEKQFSFNAIKNKVGYTPATCAVIMGRNHLLKELWNAGKLGISIPEQADSYDAEERYSQKHVIEFIGLLDMLSKEQPYGSYNKKLLEKKAGVPSEPLFTLVSCLHHHDASLLNQENIQQLGVLSVNNLRRISMLVDNLLKHNLLNNLSFTSALQRILVKVPSPAETNIFQVTGSDDQLKTETTLTNGHRFWMSRDNTLFARGGQGTIRQAYSSSQDVEPVYCIKQIQSGVVSDLKEAARREAKNHGLLSRTAFFFSDREVAFVVSSWQPGQALGRYSRAQLLNLPFDMRLKCIITALRDLNQLHSRYRTYNDIKPLNFILDVPGQALRLIDFGSVLKHGSTKKTMYTELYRDPVHKIGFPNDTYGMGLIVAVLFPELFAESFISDSSQLLVNPNSASPKHKAIIKLVQALTDKDIEKRCTIADALSYSESLIEKLPSLDEESLDAMAQLTISRTTIRVEDVLRDARLSRK
ncbi:ankyrin repeat domain-containing protein [Legionella rowbothamii]|uniref:ankyrin repeat domain-containing protein n=1 Tax=Legionella rowbothamii TaxID=96229 RepID=UPI0010566844|nr:ankyrin repeat domain-containing protein [Legionella rowbothamii]